MSQLINVEGARKNLAAKVSHLDSSYASDTETEREDAKMKDVRLQKAEDWVRKNVRLKEGGFVASREIMKLSRCSLQDMRLIRLAFDNVFHGLATKCMRDALRGWRDVEVHCCCVDGCNNSS